jgi:cytochrome bd-type quinol oxidase subunit 1
MVTDPQIVFAEILLFEKIAYFLEGDFFIQYIFTSERAKSISKHQNEVSIY